MNNYVIIKNTAIGDTVIMDGPCPTDLKQGFTIVQESIGGGKRRVYKFPPYISNPAAKAVLALLKHGPLYYGKGLRMFDMRGMVVPEIRLRNCGVAHSEGFADRRDDTYTLTERGRAVFAPHVTIEVNVPSDAAHMVREAVASVTGGFQ